MKIKTISFPSVLEPAFGNTENSAHDLLNGLKIKHRLNWYIVGNLAKTGGVNATRIINAAPTEDDFEILLKTALVIASQNKQNPLTITMGFPFSTYNIYKGSIEQLLAKRNFLIEFDTQTFNAGGNIKKAMVEIEKFDIIPEIVGSIIGLKNIYGQKGASGSFVVISLGFGTMEGAMASKTGLVQRTVFSTFGIRYAINNFSRELNKQYYLSLQNEYQLDDAFVNGYITINRKKIDLSSLKKEILTQYYRAVISPAIRKYITDNDFQNCETIYLVGGGSNYQDLADCFNEEFQDIITVTVPPQPENVTSTGYLYNTLRINSNNGEGAIGLDLGNSSTVISMTE